MSPVPPRSKTLPPGSSGCSAGSPWSSARTRRRAPSRVRRQSGGFSADKARDAARPAAPAAGRSRRAARSAPPRRPGSAPRDAGGGQRLGRARGHQTSRLPIDVQPVEARVASRPPGASSAAPSIGGYWLRPLSSASAAARRIGRALGVGETLAEVDRAVLDREPRHHLEDGRRHPCARSDWPAS